MENLIIISVLALILGLSIFHIYKAKKSGAVCIGCPHGKSCCGKDCCNNKIN